MHTYILVCMQIYIHTHAHTYIDLDSKVSNRWGCGIVGVVEKNIKN